MKKTLIGMFLVGIWLNAFSDVILTGIMDGTLAGGKPKAIELFIAGTEDLGGYEIWRSQNGDPFGSGLGSVAALNGVYTDTFVYLVKSDHVVEFHSVFGDTGYYAHVIPLAIVSGNGNEGYQIRDTVGDVVVDQVWLEDPTDSYRDSYWYRINGTGPDGTWLAANWGSPGNDALDGLDEAGLRAAVPFGSYAVVWKGISNTWNDAANWMPGVVPSQHCNVHVVDTVALFPVITDPPEDPAECYSLTVAEGASVTVAAGKALTVFGKLLINGSNTADRFVLDSDSSMSATGSLLLKGASDDSIQIRRYIPNDDSWHFLSAPVTGQLLQPGFAPDPLENTFDLYCWQENVPMTQGWMNIRDENGNLNPLFDTAFLLGKGYLAAYSDQYDGNMVKTFRGIPYNDNIILAFMGFMNHWNLMGNPYSCAMDWSSDGIARNVVTGGAMYIWDQSLNNGSGAYRTHNGSTGVPAGTTPYIPAMNGFFVNAPMPATMMLNVEDQSILTHATQNYYKSLPGSEPGRIRLKISKDVYSDETLIILNEEASNGFDPEMDALKLSNGVNEAPEISSMTGGNIKLCIQQLGYTPVSVPLSVDHGHNDSLCITAFDLEGLSPDIGILLEDLLTGDWQDLREEPEYAFLNEVPGTTGRFILHLMDVTHVQGHSDNNCFRAYLSGRKIFVKASLHGDIHYQLFDMGGRIVSQGRFMSYIDASTCPSGIYILRIFSGEQAFQLKIII